MSFTKFSLEDTQRIVYSSQISSRLLPKSLCANPEYLFFRTCINGVYIGRSEYLNVPVFWNRDYYINGHCCIVGMTGSGKTYMVKSFLSRAMAFTRSNAFIIDWTGEYSHWAKDFNGFVIDPLQNSLNFFIVDSHEYAEEHFSEITDIIATICKLSEEEKKKLERIIVSLYHPELTFSYEELIETIKTQENALYERLNHYHKFLKKLFSGATTLNDYIKSNSIVCIDLSKIENESERIAIARLMLRYLVVRMRMSRQEENTFIVVDEAWRVLKSSSTDILIREGRKYNHNILLATQSILDFEESVFSNIGSFFIFKLQSSEERKKLAKALLLEKELCDILVSLPRGQCLCYISFNSGTIERILVKQVEGEVGIVWYRINLGENMEITIEREFLIRRLREINLDSQDIAEIMNYLDTKKGFVSLLELIKRLKAKRVSVGELIFFMRGLNIQEDVIVSIMSTLSDYSKSYADVELVADDARN